MTSEENVEMLGYEHLRQRAQRVQRPGGSICLVYSRNSKIASKIKAGGTETLVKN